MKRKKLILLVTALLLIVIGIVIVKGNAVEKTENNAVDPEMYYKHNPAGQKAATLQEVSQITGQPVDEIVQKITIRLREGT